MLLKVSYILLGYLLVDGFFLNTYGANVSLTFTLDNNDGRTCKVTNNLKIGDLEVKNLTVHVGDRINLTFRHNNFMNVIECFVTSEKENMSKKFLAYQNPKVHSDDGQQYVKNLPVNITSDNDEGMWFCQTLTLRDNPQLANFPYHDGHKYVQHKCYVNVFVQLPNDDTDIATKPAIPSLWIYVGIGVGLLVLVVIIAQTGVILYLKYKAQKTARLDSLSLRPHDRDETDTKRYSKPPGNKMSRFSRMLRRSTNNDESIYETLEELRNADRTPPVPPIETIPTLKQKQKLQNPEGTSKSLPRREKARPPPNLSATLHRIPAERQRSPELDISKRPPLPLPTEVPEERSATPSRIQRTPFSPIEEDEHPTTHTLIRPSRPGIGQSSVASELDNVFKIRKASLAPQAAKNIPPAPPKKHSFPNLRGKPNKVSSDLNDSADHGKFVPDTPNPLPTGKSAVLLGLTPGPAPKTTNTNAVKSPPKPLPNSSVKPVPTPGSPIKPTVTSKTPKTPASVPVGSKPVKPPPGSVMLPRAPTNMAATKAPVMPSKPASAVKLPKPSMTADKPAGLRPVPQNIRPDKPMTTLNTPRPVPKLPTPSMRKPPPLPPPQEPIQEAVYAESEEPLYDEEWTPPDPHPQKFEKPTPQLPMASIGKPPPLPPPNRPTEEDEYEEFAEEPLYNSDDEEWVYEPLQKYNIYSS